MSVCNRCSKIISSEKSTENWDWADLFYEKGCGFHVWDIDKGSAGIKVSKFTSMEELKVIKNLIAKCKL